MRIDSFLFGSLVVILLPFLPNWHLHADDWPQILGPHRNGHGDNEKLLDSWPEAGPPLVWSHRVGEGYAGVAVSGDRTIVFHRVDEKERVEALDCLTGELIWKVDFSTSYAGGYNADNGPRCTPVIDKSGDRIFVYGAAGDLHCVTLSQGKKIWSRAARADYGAQDGYFGAGSSPIVADDKLLVNVGGRRAGAGLVAFSLKNGKTIWKTTDHDASYSSPTLARLNGRTHVIFVTRLHTLCIDPRDGKVRFEFPFGQRGPTVNAATPLVFGEHLFVTASYGVGAALLRISDENAKAIWSSDEVMSSQYTTCVQHQGYLYGTDGREDIGVAKLRCIEVASGKPQWTVDDFGVSHIILADEKLLIFKVDGQLVLADVSPKAFRLLAKARVFQGTSRALPALSNGRLYVRSTTSRSDQLKCLQVGR